MALVTIGTTALDSVASLTVEWYDLSNQSTRNANGDMILKIVNDKRKLSITTKYMTQSEMSAFFALIPSGSLSVKFYDPYTGAEVTKNMYRGDRSVTFKWDLATKLYEPMTISLIEL